MNEPRVDAEGRVVIVHRDVRGKTRDEILAIASDMLDEMIAHQIDEREIELMDEEGLDATALGEFRVWAEAEALTKKGVWLDLIRRRLLD